MKFKSTRGGVSGATFEECISQGYAPDGGLYVPEQMPKIDRTVLEAWRKLDFRSLAEEVLSIFISEEELPRADLAAIVRASFTDFSSPEVVPVVPLGGKAGKDQVPPPLFISELFHGPTFCFKDLGQQPLVRLLARFTERRGSRRTILVATTGDTGPAAMRAVADAASPNLRIVVFFPEGQISELQRRQMTTRAGGSGSSAQVVSFQGGGDDMDLPLKRLAADKDFAARHGLCGLNSYNLGRPVAQMVHYIWTYFRVLDQLGLPTGSEVDVVLPSGALGNITAGYMARQMGLPIRRLVAGVNSNDITHRTFSKGEFHRSACMEKTLSDAINVQVPYNMERLLFYLTNEDPLLISSWMAEMESMGKVTLPPEWLLELQKVFGSARVDDPAMCAAMRRSLEEHNYLPDPHTAVGLAAAWSVAESATNPVPTAVLATASPCKFAASVSTAVGVERWTAYAAGPEFPPLARQVLQMEEGPCGLFTAASSLEESQKIWEGKVREMLDEAERAREAPSHCLPC